MPYSFEIGGLDLSELCFVRFLEELPDELPHPVEATGPEVVHLVLFLLFVPGQKLLHPIKGVLTTWLQVQII